MLLQEEMRRVLAFLAYKAARWTELGAADSRPVGLPLSESLCAYAERQAQLQRDMADSFTAKWSVLRGRELTTDELKKLLGGSTGTCTVQRSRR